jgi:hypothetical protein
MREHLIALITGFQSHARELIRRGTDTHLQVQLGDAHHVRLAFGAGLADGDKVQVFGPYRPDGGPPALLHHALSVEAAVDLFLEDYGLV